MVVSLLNGHAIFKHLGLFELFKQRSQQAIKSHSHISDENQPKSNETFGPNYKSDIKSRLA